MGMKAALMLFGLLALVALTTSKPTTSPEETPATTTTIPDETTTTQIVLKEDQPDATPIPEEVTPENMDINRKLFVSGGKPEIALWQFVPPSGWQGQPHRPPEFNPAEIPLPMVPFHGSQTQLKTKIEVQEPKPTSKVVKEEEVPKGTLPPTESDQLVSKSTPRGHQMPMAMPQEQHMAMGMQPFYHMPIRISPELQMPMLVPQDRQIVMEFPREFQHGGQVPNRNSRIPTDKEGSEQSKEQGEAKKQMPMRGSPGMFGRPEEPRILHFPMQEGFPPRFIPRGEEGMPMVQRFPMQEQKPKEISMKDEISKGKTVENQDQKQEEIPTDQIPIAERVYVQEQRAEEMPMSEDGEEQSPNNDYEKEETSMVESTTGEDEPAEEIRGTQMPDDEPEIGESPIGEQQAPGTPFEEPQVPEMMFGRPEGPEMPFGRPEGPEMPFGRPDVPEMPFEEPERGMPRDFGMVEMPEMRPIMPEQFAEERETEGPREEQPEAAVKQEEVTEKPKEVPEDEAKGTGKPEEVEEDKEKPTEKPEFIIRFPEGLPMRGQAEEPRGSYDERPDDFANMVESYGDLWRGNKNFGDVPQPYFERDF